MSSQDTLKLFFPKSERAKEGGETVIGVYCISEESASKKNWKGNEEKEKSKQAL